MSKMSQAAMAARIAELEAQVADLDPNKCKVELADGITNQGVRYCHLKIKGGAFGWRGLIVRRHQWEALKQQANMDLLDRSFEQHRETFDAYYASKS